MDTMSDTMSGQTDTRWSDDDLPGDLRVTNVKTPDGYGIDDIDRFESEAEAVMGDGEDEWGEPTGFPFNPQNGRRYEVMDPGCARYDSARAAGALTVKCAYEDCDGTSSIEVQDQVNRNCPECGEPQMGRAQFSKQARRRRSRHDSIASRSASLHDDFSKEMSRLTDAGAGTIAAMDYIMCSIGEIPYEEWAAARGVSAQSVRRNINRVADAVGEQLTFKTRGH